MYMNTRGFGEAEIEYFDTSVLDTAVQRSVAQQGTFTPAVVTGGNYAMSTEPVVLVRAPQNNPLVVAGIAVGVFAVLKAITK